MKNSKSKIVGSLAAFCLLHFAFSICANAQEQPPAPGAPKSVSVPAVQEKKLPNGLTVATVQRTGVPLVTIQLLVKCGASTEDASKAGLADITASMLTKGTKARTATEIAEGMEFLGASINSGAGWNSSFVSVTVTSDKVEQALAIMSDVVLNPKFDEKELDLLKSQTLDGLTYNLKQPSFLANYVASKYSFFEHPAGGTPSSIASITKGDVERFYKNNYGSDLSVLIFSGDIDLPKASSLATSTLGSMTKTGKTAERETLRLSSERPDFSKPFNRLLIIDLPKSGQASVGFFKTTSSQGRKSKIYYSAQVLNSVLGGGYSSRLNMEIRIKRGLSYGAGSGFSWRPNSLNFSTRAQTKNESAPEVAELVLQELKRLKEETVSVGELIPRKSVLTGNFGRSLETTSGLASAIGELYAFGISTDELNKYVASVNGVNESQIMEVASQHLPAGDLIIVGDYSVFKDDLAKRFPNIKVDVIKAADLDLSKDNLRK
ncbi:MAG: M16 family metallopeptidase [Pyrinomonadaceae bacterium]